MLSGVACLVPLGSLKNPWDFVDILCAACSRCAVEAPLRARAPANVRAENPSPADSRLPDDAGGGEQCERDADNRCDAEQLYADP